MPSLPVIPAKDLIDYLLKFGCVQVSVKGSHHKIEYPASGKRTPIPVHGNRDVDKAFLKAILSQLGIDVSEFLKFIKNN